MTELDDDLTRALRRENPPAGFAERVLRRVGGPIRLKPDPTRILTTRILTSAGDSTSAGVETGARRSELPFIQWAAAAALVAAMAGGVNYIAKQKERAEGEAASARVVLALHIAGTKLQLVQTKINRLHEQPERNSNQ